MQKISSHKSRRGRPRTPISIKLKILELYRKGLSPREIRRNFEEAGLAKIPGLRTIEYAVEDYERRSEAEKEQDGPFDILHLDRARIPPECLPVILSVIGGNINELANFLYAKHTRRGVFITGNAIAEFRHVITNREARWLWWVHNAASGLDPQEVWRIAQYLAAAEQAEEVFGEKLPTDWVTGYMALKPWTGSQAEANWREAIELGVVPEPPKKGEIDEVIMAASLFGNIGEARKHGLLSQEGEPAPDPAALQSATVAAYEEVMGRYEQRPYRQEE